MGRSRFLWLAALEPVSDFENNLRKKDDTKPLPIFSIT